MEADHQNKKIHEISHKIDTFEQIFEVINIEITIHDQTQTEENRLISVPIQTLGIDTIPTKDHEIHHTIETETILTKEIEAIQIIEISIIQTTNQEIIHTIDQIIKDSMSIIKTDQETIHKRETQIITKSKEIIPNLLIGIITVTPYPKTDIEAIHQNIKDKLIKYKQLRKQLQTPLVLMIRKILNYN